MLLCYITDRSQFPGDEASRRRRLLQTIAHATRSGVDYIQLREKNLSSRDLELLACEAVASIRELRADNKAVKGRLLINSRTDVALACGADGVHLRSNDISPTEVRNIWARSGTGPARRVTVGVSCHTPAEVVQAAAEGADFVVYGPIFEKKGGLAVSLDGLREACQEKIPVLALGGITTGNAGDCVGAGAAGVAGIRLFQENEIGKAVGALRANSGRSSPTKLG